jgi:hypothetical protein
VGFLDISSVEHSFYSLLERPVSSLFAFIQVRVKYETENRTRNQKSVLRMVVQSYHHSLAAGEKLFLHALQFMK